MTYHAIRASNRLAVEKGVSFKGFGNSKYASGDYFDKYTEAEWLPATEKVKGIFEEAGIHIPTRQDWLELKAAVMDGGLYNQNLQAVPPTGSISYINHSTSSIHPIVSKIEIRKEGKIGRVYYPAAFMTNDNLEYYQDAYEIGPDKIIDTYAAATQHVDQGSVADAVLPRHRDDARYQPGADLRLEEGHQDHLLHPPSPDGAIRHGSAGLRLVRAVTSGKTMNIRVKTKAPKAAAAVRAINWNRIEDDKDLEVWSRLTGNFWLRRRCRCPTTFPPGRR